MSQIKDPTTSKSLIALLSIGAFSVLLLILRLHFTRDGMYLFLVWNTILALFPWGLSLFLPRLKSAWLFWPCFLLWLLFFPNAPYLITDFIHLGKRPLAPLWYDALLLLSFSLTGLVAGLSSLRRVEGALRLWVPRPLVLLILLGSLLLSGGAIFLGRFLRWNSWDLFLDLPAVMGDVLRLVVGEKSSWRFWGFTVLFAVFQAMLYWALVVPLMPLAAPAKEDHALVPQMENR
jgi:uncharacterized membrane protein